MARPPSSGSAARSDPSTSATSAAPVIGRPLSRAARRTSRPESVASLALIMIVSSWLIATLRWLRWKVIAGVRMALWAHQFKRLLLGHLIRFAYARREADEGPEGGRRAAFLLRRGREAGLHAIRRLAADRGARARGRIGPHRAQPARDPAHRRRRGAGAARGQDPRPPGGGRGRAGGDRRAARRPPAARVLPHRGRDAPPPRDRGVQRPASGRRVEPGRGRARREPPAPQGGRARPDP